MEEKPRRFVSQKEILLEFEELRARLDEAESTLDAIRTGEVDALIVQGANGQQVYTLKGANDNYRIFVERMQEGAVTLNSEGVILYCNQSFAEMTGRPLETLIGHNFDQFLKTTDQPKFLELMRGANGELARVEIVVANPVGEIPALLSLSTLDDDSDATYALTLTDLSIQKGHEQQLQKANKELEGFCYSISHDLRAPLRSIVSAASIVVEDCAGQISQDSFEELGRIKAAANHLGMLIDDLLTYARLSRHSLKFDDVDLTALANKIAVRWEADSDRKVEWVIEPSLQLRADPRLLEMVLENLLSNALKYSAKTPVPRIEVGQEEFEDGPAFFVRDNGIGFDMAYVDKVFVPFERLHTHDEYPGTGIGLANVQRILTRHGGRIWADAALGRGATFYFTIPRKQSAPSPNPESQLVG